MMAPKKTTTHHPHRALWIHHYAELSSGSSTWSLELTPIGHQHSVLVHPALYPRTAETDHTHPRLASILHQDHYLDLRVLGSLQQRLDAPHPKNQVGCGGLKGAQP